MYDYNTGREPMKLRQFGRNVQNLAKYITTIESKEDRTNAAAALVELMKQIVPSVKTNQESNQLLWDDLHILADFNLDIDAPYPVPEKDIFERKPDSIGYVQDDIPFRHYGRNVILMIAEARKIEDPTAKEAAVFQIARLMKTFHMTWNKETPDNETIAKNIEKLSEGELKLNLEMANELELMEPLYKEAPKPVVVQTKSSKGGGKSQNRRRR